MKIILFSISVIFLSLKGFSQLYTGPVAKPVSGYGSDGSRPIGVESFSNPYFTTENIQIFYPSDLSGPVPTLFYSHAYGGSNSLHVIGLLNFIARKGYAIVFVPYQTTGVSVANRYENLLSGFRKAARDFPAIIDTTRVGFMGHSFGGGASFATSYACFTENNWGSNGRFIHSSAPWYLYNISQGQLTSFPADTKLIVEIYNDDTINDHRMAADAFLNINIPTSEKDFIAVKSSTVSGYDYTVGHDLPTSYAAFDALDYFAYYRIIDALCDYTFNGNSAGKDVALGNGSSNQTDMPAGMQSLEQTDSPTVSYPESNFGFPCSSVANPRSSYCGLLAAVDESFRSNKQSIWPNPGESILNIEMENVEEVVIEIYNAQGQLVLMHKNQITIDVSGLHSGIYYCFVKQGSQGYFHKFVKR